MQTVSIDMETWLDMLEARRGEWDDGQHREIPDCVWDYAMELLEECGGCSSPEQNDPRYIVDNLLVNGSWEDFDDARREGETDEELIARVEDDAVAVFPEEKIILYNLGF